LITVNNGEKKWQVSPAEEQVYIFPSFPDPYKFTLELGNEIKMPKMPNKSKPWEKRWLRKRTSVFEVLPRGGNPTKYGLTRRRICRFKKRVL